MCSGGVASGSPAAKNLIVCGLPGFHDLEVLRRQAGDRRPLLVGDDDAEVHQVDAAAKRLLPGGERRRDCQSDDDCRRSACRRSHGAPQNTLKPLILMTCVPRLPSPLTPRKP